MNNLKIIVATHKKYNMPEDNIYIPIHVGKERTKEDLGYIGDNTGDNISTKNENYCELTALYWMWKNLDCEFVGISHYRRYLGYSNRKPFSNHTFESLLKEEDYLKLLNKYQMIIPKKRNYYIETVWNHYKNAHFIQDLEVTKNVISDISPEYLDSFEHVMSKKHLHLFNMLVTHKSIFDNYCEWLFQILFELEKRIDISEYDSYQKRIFGFISERLLNVWVHYNKINFVEKPIVTLEKENKLKKAYKLVERKYKKAK